MTRLSHYFACLTVACCSIAASDSGLHAQDFILRPGDAVRVFVPRDTGLSGTFDVDAASVLTLPLIGRVSVAAKPWSQVSDSVMTAYRRQVRELGITLTPLRRVLVLGAVNKPGRYFLEPTMTLSHAIAAASGATADGSIRRVRILRGDSTFNAFAPKGSQIVDIPVASGDRVFVLKRGWAERNSNLLASAILSLTGIIVALATR